MLFILIWWVRYVTITVTLWMGVWLVFAPYLGVSLIIFLNNSEKESCMQCPFCHHQLSKVIETNKNAPGGIRRRRECLSCGERFSTLERSILATPLVVKQDGTREEFNHEKLMQVSGLPAQSDLYQPLKLNAWLEKSNLLCRKWENQKYLHE